ncbi:replication factor C subunit 1 [Elysia marginata]|uniref:Replication factor C subunit 1 n=1 Tax=Elysia marginata TaxID=1093978 RepID=A0AAV4JZP3_9GAST|nr:replication factor C subunit 1 [Elysia marginata]
MVSPSDIRKFFGPASSSKPSNQASKSSDGPKKEASKTKEVKKTDTKRNTKGKETDASQKNSKKPSSPSKKLNLNKKFESELDESIVVEDFSDEEVIKSSLDSKQNGLKSKSDDKPTKEKSSVRNKSSKPKREESLPVAKNVKNNKGNGKKHSSDLEEVIDIDSIPSSGSSTTKSQKNAEKSKARSSLSKSDSAVSTEESGKKKKLERKESVPTRTSPRKQNSSVEEKKESRKRVMVIKMLLHNFAPQLLPEKSTNYTVMKINWAMLRVPDGVCPVCHRPNEEEKKMTALDKFVIHNQTTPVKETVKKVTNSESTPKEKAVSVADFFGDGSASRSSRTTAVAKRKHEETEENVLAKETSVDLTFDEEMHEDNDFMKTLDQLDGPTVKKVKPSNETEVYVCPENEKPSSGSLASKLAGKMKQVPKEESKTATKTADSGKSTEKSPSSKPQANGKPSPKKGKVYTMEVERKKPPTVIVSPAKSKKQEEVTPAKPSAKKALSAEKTNDNNDNDDGFGGPKGIKGFQAFKARGGPLALGSKEIPEGAENCLEGLTFVITGVLDSIDRDDAKSLVEKHGGKVTGNVSGRTSYLVVGREPGESKVKKAASLKLKELDEDGLFDLIKNLPGKTSKYEIQAKQQIKKEASIKAEKEKEELKRAESAKKLESFRSDKDTRNTASTTSTPSPKKQKSLFTQLKGSTSDDAATTISTDTTAAPSPASSAKLLSQSQSPSQKGLDSLPGARAATVDKEPESLLWVDKHKPISLKQIIGQQGDKSNARKLFSWLKAWHNNVIVKGLKPSGNFFNKGDGAGCRAALLSGPPGIGKTTTATLVCKELGFSYVELNASDTRSKRSLKEVVAESLDNNTLVDYTGSGDPHRSSNGQSHCLIMDEVDGMAGNEDRGGLQELVQLIKKSKIPIICICNDRNSMKMRTLSNYCLDLRFQRPRVEQIKGAMMSLAFKEGLKIPPAALNEIILASNHDIRQVIHNMSMWSAGDKNMTFDQIKNDAKKAQKDIKLGPFDVCRKVFVSDEETRKMTINDKSDLFFNDYSFGPLFVHENYVKVIPNLAKGEQARHLSCLARTIDSICDGDLIDRLVRRDGNWNLLPSQAMFSSVIPGELMRGSFPQMTDFPQWLGKFSSTNKTQRILQELSTHMRLEVSCDKRGLSLDYLPSFRSCLTQPLVSQGTDGVPEVIKIMDDYDIVKEDFDNIMEVTKWPKSFDPMSQLDSKTKAAFTRQYNKQIHMTPYATGATGGKKRKARGAPMEEEALVLEEGAENGDGLNPPSDEEEEEEGIEADTMIKSKKAAAGKAKAGSTPADSGSKKGKGKGKGSKK